MNASAPLSRRRLLQYSSAAAIGAISIAPAWSQGIAGNMDSAKIVVGSPAGTILDALARRIADAISPGYARNVIVENRVGGSGQIAVTYVKNAAPDSATILLTPMPMMAMYTHPYKRLPYDPVADFTPVSLGATLELALGIGPMVPASVKTVADLVVWCKANPALSNFGSPAAGSTPLLPGKTPVPQVQRLSLALKKASETREVTQAMVARGLEAKWSTPAELAERLKADSLSWGAVIKGLGFTAES